jgi:hypothetical protein
MERKSSMGPRMTCLIEWRKKIRKVLVVLLTVNHMSIK